MIKVSVLLTRRPGISHQEFISYWTNEHARLLCGLDEFTSVVRRYTQQHVLESPEGLPKAPYDGVAELWFDNKDSIGQTFEQKVYEAVVVPDEEMFLDRAKTVILITERSKLLMVDLKH
jgi:uncharacterized protein (TIGR02118 family)